MLPSDTLSSTYIHLCSLRRCLFYFTLIVKIPGCGLYVCRRVLYVLSVCTCTCTYGPPPESRSPLKKVNEASIHPFIPAFFPQYIPQTLLRSRPIRLHSLRTCSFSNPRCAILPIDNSQTFFYIRILPLSPSPPPPETQIELLSNRLVRLRATSSVSIRPV